METRKISEISGIRVYGEKWQDNGAPFMLDSSEFKSAVVGESDNVNAETGEPFTSVSLVCTLVKGGQVYFPLHDGCSLCVGDSVDTNSIIGYPQTLHGKSRVAVDGTAIISDDDI